MQPARHPTEEPKTADITSLAIPEKDEFIQRDSRPLQLDAAVTIAKNAPLTLQASEGQAKPAASMTLHKPHLLAESPSVKMLPEQQSLMTNLPGLHIDRHQTQLEANRQERNGMPAYFCLDGIVPRL